MTNPISDFMFGKIRERIFYNFQAEICSWNYKDDRQYVDAYKTKPISGWKYLSPTCFVTEVSLQLTHCEALQVATRGDSQLGEACLQ